MRDYIHVVDLALGHVKAVEKLADNEGVSIYNLGTGNGYSVLQVVHAFEKACGHAINYAIKPRRPGDIAMCYCDPAKAKKELGWEAQYGIEDMCADSWRWQSQNPNGYDYATGKAEIKTVCKTIVHIYGCDGCGTGNSCNHF